MPTQRVSSVRDRVWWNLATRPVLGLLVRERHLEPLPGSRTWNPPKPRTFYAVQHPVTRLYWRNPWPHHHVATPEWGTQEQAYRFHSRDYALDVMAEQGLTATVIECHVRG